MPFGTALDDDEVTLLSTDTLTVLVVDATP